MKSCGANSYHDRGNRTHENGDDLGFPQPMRVPYKRHAQTRGERVVYV